MPAKQQAVGSQAELWAGICSACRSEVSVSVAPEEHTGDLFDSPVAFYGLYTAEKFIFPSVLAGTLPV